MERVTVSLDEDLLRQFDGHMARHGYANRSEAVRDILRRTLEAERLAEDETGHCVACLSYIYNHHERELSRRLTQASHDHHDLTLSTVHLHLDHETCMEVVLLQGPTGAVRRFADTLAAETGVRHGQLNAVPVDMGGGHHHHHHPHPSPSSPSGETAGASRHTHARPKT